MAETNYKVTMSEKQYNDYLQYLTTTPHEDGRHPFNIVAEEIFGEPVDL